MRECQREALQGSSVLLVDDNIHFRHKLKRLFEGYFERVYEASDGEEGAALYQSAKPNVVFTDIKMPQMCGLTLSSFVRRLDDAVPIVVLSAYSEKEILKKLIPLNLVDFIDKPIDFGRVQEVLVRCAQVLIDRGSLEQPVGRGVAYSPQKKRLIIHGDEVALTHKEMLFLELMIANKNRTVTREQVEEAVYGGEHMSLVAVRNLVSKIRKKAGQNIIRTIPNVGFVLAE